jgi:hypothetical protein
MQPIQLIITWTMHLLLDGNLLKTRQLIVHLNAHWKLALIPHWILVWGLWVEMLHIPERILNPEWNAILNANCWVAVRNHQRMDGDLMIRNLMNSTTSTNSQWKDVVTLWVCTVTKVYLFTLSRILLLDHNVSGQSVYFNPPWSIAIQCVEYLRACHSRSPLETRSVVALPDWPKFKAIAKELKLIKQLRGRWCSWGLPL